MSTAAAAVYVARRRTTLRVAAFVGVAALLLAIPYTLSPVNQSLYATMGLSAIVTVGLTLLMGFGGQVSFGQGAFYALGAYATGLLATKQGWPTIPALVASPVVTAVVAGVIGVPLLRLRGHFLAFATLALHLILLALILTWNGFTGGEIGLVGIPKLSLAGHAPGGAAYDVVIWASAIVIVLISLGVVSSRAGRALRTLATSESSAAAAGVDVGGYKLRLFILSAAFAGLAGGLYADFINYLSPDSFPIMISVEFVVMAAVGGMGSVYGGVLGAIGITLLQHELEVLGTMHGMPLQAPKVLSIGVYGLVLTLVLLFLPRGVLPALVELAGDIRRRLAPAA